MQNEDIIRRINELLINEIEIDESVIKPGAHLKEDLGIDSLDFVDLFVIMEKNFGFKMKAEEMADVRLLNDFYQYVINRVNPSNR